MDPFEDFRTYLVRRLADELGLQVENRTTWELWLAIHEECPEAARIASDQWLNGDLLAEHLRYDDHVRNLKAATHTGRELSHAPSGLADYVCRWQQFNARIQTAIAKRQPVALDPFWST